MAIVVSDTSPVRALAHLGNVGWLEVCFREVLIPPAVVDELLHPAPKYAPVDVHDFPFLQIRAPTQSLILAELKRELDEGEAQALALAKELFADQVLIDEADGRRAAQRLGIPVIGTIGILLQAKRRLLCPAIAPLLDRLVGELDFFISASLRAKALKMADE